MMNISHKWSSFLDGFLPHRIVNRAIVNYNRSLDELKQKLDNMSVGEGYAGLGELADGEWHWTEPGVKSRLVFSGDSVEQLMEMFSLIESIAVSDTEKISPHRHGGIAGIRNQVINVLSGKITVLTYESEKGPLLYSTQYGKNATVLITPDMWHAVLFEKDTHIATFMFPRL